MEPIEFIEMQALSRKAYKTSVARVQNRWRFTKRTRAMFLAGTFCIKDEESKKWRFICKDPFRLNNAKFITVLKSIIAVQGGSSLVVTKFDKLENLKAIRKILLS